MRTLVPALAAWLVCAPPASAQSEEIVVTATKRGDARAQDLPVALSVLGEDELQVRNVEDLQSLSYALPNVQLEDIGTARGIANFSIRGVGVNSSIASVDPAVGLFVDGVYIGVNAGALTDLLDVEAIEVMRGPQGALYGRNVTGGAVLVRTRAPSDAFEARTRLAIETGTQVTYAASISGPIQSGVLTARVAVHHAADQGWLTNGFDGSSFGQNETRIYRGALRYTPSPRLEVLLRAEHGSVEGDGPAGQNHALYRRGSFDFAIDNPGHAGTDWTQATLEANLRVPFGEGRITSITAWRSVEVPWRADIDSTPAFVFHTRVLNDHEQFSQELRYAGTFGAFDLTGGVYFLDQTLLYIDERNFSPTFRRVGGGHGRFTSHAAFAQADWHIGDAFTLGMGARFTSERKTSRISRVRMAGDDLDGATVNVPGEGIVGGDIDARTLAFSDAPFEQHWKDLSPRIALQWRPDADTNLYATWSRAFRGGGANFRTASLGLPPLAYDREAQSTFELGWKQQLAGNRASVGAAVFRNRISDMQRETNQPDAISGVQQIVLNAGDATIFGGEVEARLDLSSRLGIAAHAGYVHGKYDRITEDLNGDLVIDGADYALRIPRLAPWSYGVSADYSLPVLGGDMRARLSLSHRDAAFYSESNFGRLPAADMIDAYLSYAPAGAPWRLSLHVENLLNEATWGGDTILPSTAAFGYSGGERPTFSPLNKGRVMGVEVRAQF